MAHAPVKQSLRIGGGRPAFPAVFACLLGLAVAQAAFAADRVPVMVGQSGDNDACGTLGEVTGLSADGENFLAVRTGPGAGFDKADEVHAGDFLYICDRRGGWLGVVYAHDGIECGVDTPWDTPAAYTGPCRSGWVSSKYVKDYAG